MPIYAYKCGSCGHAKDVLQKLSDAPLTVCPACGAESFSKQVTAAGFQLKGSGWYVTDFRGGDKGAPPKADGEKAGAEKAETGQSESPKTEGTKTEASAGESNGSSKSESAPAPAASSSPSPAPAPSTPSSPGTK
jgi:putative FmdB family regulatory protein